MSASNYYTKADKLICYLNITTWQGISIGAIHYYGSLNFRTKKITLKRKVTKQDIEQKKERFLTIGDSTEGFNSEEDLISLAKKQWKKHFPEAKALVLGSPTHIEPHKMLIGPHKRQCNFLYNQAKNLGFYDYEKNYDTVDKLSNQWYKLICTTSL